MTRPAEMPAGTHILTVKAEVMVPRVPNFLLFACNDEEKISIADVTDAALSGLGAEWTKRLIERAHEIRASRSPSPETGERNG